MSLIRRIEEIVKKVANEVSRTAVNVSVSQVANDGPQSVKVISVDGVNITIELPDGTQQTVGNAGSRVVGPNDTGLLCGGAFM
jgi:hypothetical protein